MEQKLDDGEFWLPSEFLTDDELLMDFKIDRFSTKPSDELSYGFGNANGFHSDLSSPVESVMGSTETESDEDDFIIGLTRKMANSTLQDYNLSSDYPAKGLKLSGSPQSTLFGCKHGSSRGSPNSVSQVSSPPDGKEGFGLDLLYAAAGEVARMRMIEEMTAVYSRKLFVPPPKTSPVSASPNISYPTSGFYQNLSQDNFSYHQLQASRFEQMKQQQMLKSGAWALQNANFQLPGMRNGEGRPQGLSMGAWPTLQQSQKKQQPGSGMRAVFLGETGVKKERAGTGVFLPRGYGNNPTEINKKTECPKTVLLPEKVVQALNSNLESKNAQLHRNGANLHFTSDYGAALKSRNNVGMAQQRRILRPQPVVNQELLLPQEWTY